MKKYKAHIVWLVIAVIAFGGGWFIGKSTAAAGTRGGFAGTFSSSTRGGFGARGAGGGFVAGTIASIQGGSMTISLPNGNSEVVFYSSSTAVIKPSPASVSDLTPGTTVMIGGTPNSDGSLTAQSIQVRQAGTGAGSGGFGGAASGQ